ncbi:MAG: calcium-binding protein [Actinomycetota bacterium]
MRGRAWATAAIAAAMAVGTPMVSVADTGVLATPSLTCDGRPATIVGGAGPDILIGTGGPDVIVGGGGNDTIRGLGGDDVICGGSGADDIRGGGGADRIFGQRGRDTIRGGSGGDHIDGGSSADEIDGNSGGDTIFGRKGADVIGGGSGADVINGNGGPDTITGGKGADVIRGGKSHDLLYGNSGRDSLFGNSGQDAMLGGTGADLCSGGSGNDEAGSCQTMSDEFGVAPADLRDGDPSIGANWRVRNADSADVIDIDTSAAGALVMVASESHHNGWYAANEGPFAYQHVTGDFAAAIRLTVSAVSDPGGVSTPGVGYNSGGFVVRDPDQAHDWVMYNIGGQDGAHGFAREVKTTVDASSNLHLFSIQETEYRLLVCRVGDQIRYFHGGGSSSAWTQESIVHTRADFGSTLEVGIVANAWEGGPRAWVEVDHIEFGRPRSLSDCTASVGSV